MRHIIYISIITLQICALGLMLTFLTRHQFTIELLYSSLGSFLLSILLLVIAILRGSRGSAANCLIPLLIIVNLIFYVMYFMGIALTGWVEQIKGQ